MVKVTVNMQGVRLKKTEHVHVRQTNEMKTFYIFGHVSDNLRVAQRDTE